MAAKVRVDKFYVYVKGEGKKAGHYTKEKFNNLKDAVKCAMSHKDRTNTVFVKQGWYNPKSCHTGETKVFECKDGNIWFE